MAPLPGDAPIGVYVHVPFCGHKCGYGYFAVTAGRNNIFVDRIEVLRGPQGTLYGRNSVGGALNIISKRPSDDFEGEFRLGFGNYDSAKAGFSLSGTIVEDWLRGRVFGFKEARNEGVFKNYGTGETEGYNINNWNGEVQFEGDIGDRFSWWTKYTTGRYDSAGPPGGRTTPNSNAPYDKNSFGSLTGTGAINPNQPVTLKPGSPDSDTVGTSGKTDERSSEVTASARSLPERTWGKALDGMSKPMSTSLASKAVSAGPEPL